MEGRIRSRGPIRTGISGNCSPPHRSPIRRNDRHSSPNFSGSDYDDDDTTDLELAEIDNCHDATATTNSTFNSSMDMPDGEIGMNMRMRYRHKEINQEYFPDGRLKAVNVIDKSKVIAVSQAKPETNNKALLLLGFIVIGGAALIYYTNFHHDATAGARTRQQLQCSFERSERDFPNQNKRLWKSLEFGVESVLNTIPTSPSIFLLAYEDVHSANRITRSIVERTTECMSSKGNALELSPADLAYNEMKSDYGVVITKYQNQLKRSGVMLVNDLNKVPSEVAPAFHVFCDVHNPLVDRSIIFLTLQLTGQIQSNTLGLVESYLRSNWSGLEHNILEPLITRVTDNVFLLNKD